MAFNTYDDYITAIKLGVPLQAMDGENIRRQANALLYIPSYNSYFMNGINTKEYSLGTYDTFYSMAIDEDLYKLPIPYEAPNHIMAEKVKLTKQAFTNIMAVGFYDLDNNSCLQGEAITINKDSFTPYCGIEMSGLPYPDPNTEFTLCLAASDQVDIISSYSIGWAIAAPISQYGYSSHPQVAGLLYYAQYSSGGFTREVFHAEFNGHYLDPEQAVPTGGTDGGGGDFFRYDEEIPIPPLPSLSVCDTNFISLYKVDASELADLASYLWSSSFFDNILKNWTSPLENIISLGIINYPISGSLSNILIGNLTSGIQGEKLSSTFFEIDCGNKDITKYYGNFADYDTEISLYLPYIGNVKIDPSDCMRGVINVVYHIDVFTGSCTAYVRCRTRGAWHVLYQYNGQIKVELPITGRSFIESYKAVLGAVGSAASGNIMGVASNVFNTKPTYQRSGNTGATSGYMGVQYPYITFGTPQLIQGQNFRALKGYVSNLTVKIGDVSGFISADINNSDMIGIPDATNEELEMIKQLLADGIYIE